ncbi:peptidoglycan DD-metalloendopeptidase family protein [Nostoc sp. UIC 10607]|uniref:peptidoglycan DD-metalloendopeptidase family protein n=1 Tax=Nostoc sp. UIC 10607 TaxID=3045935 RepID=UPI00399F1FBA
MTEEINLFNNNNPNSSFDLLSPYVKVTIGAIGNVGSEVFTTGDGKLLSASVTLSEGKAQSNCKFTVYDPQKRLVDKFGSYIESVGGLDPIEAPESETPEESKNEVVEGSTPGESEATIGKVLYEKTIASTFGYGESTQGGTKGAYGDIINFNGLYAAMIHPNFVGGAVDQQKWIDAYKYAKMRVTNLANNKSIVVTIVSTGPFALDGNKAARPLRPNPDRKIDLTPGAFYALTSPSTTPGLLDVKIEWLEGGTATAVISPKDKSQSKEQSANNIKKGNISKTKIGNWPTAKVAATKSIIVFPGHLADTSSGGGTSGSGDTNSVLYKGEQRVREFVANDISTTLFISELKKAGYNVISAPPTPVGRGDAARTAYYVAVQQLKEANSAYTLELHFDAPPNGRPGVIPGGKYDQSGASLNVMDVALAKEFGNFSFNHRQSLGGPSRGITLLELDALGTTLTGLINSGISSGNFAPLESALLPYAQRAVRALNNVTDGILSKTNEAADSVNNSKGAQQEKIAESKTLAGAQITIELGYNGKTLAASSFIHTGLSYSLFAPDHLEFSGTSAGWVLTQRIKNNVYTNLTFKKIATKVASAYGLKLDMPIDGPKYEYFPQRGQSDYEMLLIEARRIGLRMYVKGNVLHIKPRANILANKDTFVLTYGENMGINFTCDHTAQKDTKGGARSSDPGESTSTGVRKFEVNADTGKLEQKVKENIEATGGDTGDVSTTGSSTPTPAPKTDGTTAKEDADRKASETRIKGIGAKCDFPTTPEALSLDPDTLLLTKGISTFLDRTWVIDNVTHSYNLGDFSTSLEFYSPLKNKNGSAETTSSNTSSSNSSTTSTATDFDPNAPKFIRPATGTLTSRHRTENPSRPNHKGVDFSSTGGNGKGENIVAAASGTATIYPNSTSGYGNYIDIDHGGGWLTRYGHLHSISISNGPVKQGQIIGIEGNSGASRGTHLHWEVRKNGADLNPLKYVSAK